MAACALVHAATAATAANVILMIGDGMGGAEIAAARAYQHGLGGKLYMETLPHQASAIVNALSEDNPAIADYVGDSASGGTALATGGRTSVGRISTTARSDEDMRTILEIAQAQGLKTGIVTTAKITDATPASFAAHVRIRFCETPRTMGSLFPGLPDCKVDLKSSGGPGSIAEQMIDHKVDLMIGGGAEMLGMPVEAGSGPAKSLREYAQAQGYTVIDSAAGYSAAKLGERTLALLATKEFSKELQGEGGAKAQALQPVNDGSGTAHMPKAMACVRNEQAQAPTLEQLTRGALANLGAGEQGFFLMVEGALIDKSGHDSDPCGAIGELVAFDRAVQAAHEYLRGHPDTLLIVTSDHAQAMQVIGAEMFDFIGPKLRPGDLPGRLALIKTLEGGTMLVNYATSNVIMQTHTGANVPVFAAGSGAGRIQGTMDQTEIFAVMEAALAAERQPALSHKTGSLIKEGEFSFKDLNRNGRLDPYEDWRLAADVRARDLVGRMTLAEKAGAMMHGTARTPGNTAGIGSHYDLKANEQLIARAKVNSFITRLSSDAATLAEENNKLQLMAERSRLGIPLMVSTDPRNHFQSVQGASVAANQFSQWPETLGFAAIGDAALMRRFADIARQEYRAVGIHMALSPQADLATEPRWSRITGTFGEDAELARRMVGAYVEGFQGGASGLGPKGVATVVKHWVGYGAAKDGFDSHSYYGRYATFPGGAFEHHIKPFESAFAARVAGVMPTYSILENLVVDGREVEQVGAGFSRWLLTDLLRGRYGFDGVIVSDWKITEDCDDACRNGFAPGVKPSFEGMSTAWGVEHLSKLDRFAKGIQAGLDQFGGTEEAQYVVQAVKAGKLSEARVDESVRRIMKQKFDLGLFESPYVDPERARAIVGAPQFQAEALKAQRRSLVVLEKGKPGLPLAASVKKVFLHGISPDVARQYGFTVVTDAAEADVAIVRAQAPYQILHPNFMFGSFLHEGDLDFKDGHPDYELIKKVSAATPTVVSVYLDRPAILTNLRDTAAALLADFGVSDAALFDVLTGRARPEGRLPFQLPASMADVEAQAEDLPRDLREPLYPIFHGLAAE